MNDKFDALPLILEVTTYQVHTMVRRPRNRLNVIPVFTFGYQAFGDWAVILCITPLGDYRDLAGVTPPTATKGVAIRR